MKRLIIFLLLFAAIKVAGQTTGYLRFDTVMIYKVGGTAELVLMNKTKDSLGILTNYGNGRTRFMKSRAINDSTIVVGMDTVRVRGASGSNYWELDGSNNLVNKSFPGVKIEINKRFSILDSGYVATSNLTGSNPGEGVGYKTFWHPGKAAFRSGFTDASSFNDAFIGQYSSSFGYNATALGLASFATGIGVIAQGQASAAWGGSGTQATGNNSTAGGLGSVSGGLAATAFGNSANAPGAASFAAGFGPSANGVASVALNQTTRADGNYSVATGEGSDVNAQAGFVSGYFNQTNYSLVIPQFVIGRYSDTTIGAELFRIGWGSHVGGPKANLYSVDTAGNIRISRPEDGDPDVDSVLVWDNSDKKIKKVAPGSGGSSGGATRTELFKGVGVDTTTITGNPDSLLLEEQYLYGTADQRIVVGNTYVDNAGDDADDGETEATAKATIADLTDSLVSKSFARGYSTGLLRANSIFREQFSPTVNGIRLGAYGMFDGRTVKLPMISSSDVIPSGTDSSSLYKISITHSLPSGNPGYDYFVVVEIDTALEKYYPVLARRYLRVASSIANADATPGSFYQPSMTSPTPVYINTTEGSVGSNKYRYEIATRLSSIYATGQSGKYSYLWLENGVSGYGTVGGTNGGVSDIYLSKSILQGGATHTSVIKSGMVENCVYLTGSLGGTNGNTGHVFYEGNGLGNYGVFRRNIMFDYEAFLLSHQGEGVNDPIEYVAYQDNYLFGDSTHRGGAMGTGVVKRVEVSGNYLEFSNSFYRGGAQEQYIVNNVFRDIENESGVEVPSAQSRISHVVDNLIEFFPPNSGAIITMWSVNQNGHNTNFDHNTVYVKSLNSGGESAQVFARNSATANNTPFNVTRNIFISSTPVGTFTKMVTVDQNSTTDVTSGWVSDYNAYIVHGGSGFRWVVTNPVGGDPNKDGLAEWKSTTAQDDNSYEFNTANYPNGLKQFFVDPDNGNWTIANTPQGDSLRTLMAGKRNPPTFYPKRPLPDEAVMAMINGGFKSPTEIWQAPNFAGGSTTVDGSETKVTQGTNITVTGTGTVASPYVVSATGAAATDTTRFWHVSGNTLVNPRTFGANDIATIKFVMNGDFAGALRSTKQWLFGNDSTGITNTLARVAIKNTAELAGISMTGATSGVQPDMIINTTHTATANNQSTLGLQITGSTATGGFTGISAVPFTITHSAPSMTVIGRIGNIGASGTSEWRVEDPSGATRVTSGGLVWATGTDLFLRPQGTSNHIMFQSSTGVNMANMRNGFTRLGDGTIGTAKLQMAGNLTAANASTNGILFSQLASTVTDNSTAGSGTVTHTAVNSILTPTLAASNTSVTYTNASSLYIAAAPAAGTNVTITNPWAIHVAAGKSFHAGEFNIGSATDNGAFTLQNTGGLYQAGAVKIDLGSDATGDVYYRDGSGNFVRRGIGSTGDVLTVSGGLPVWSAPAGSTTIYTGDGTLSGNRSVLGAGNFLSLGTSGSKLLNLTVHASDDINLNPDDRVTINGGLSTKVTVATDANLTMTTNMMSVVLPDITADRTLTLPTVQQGMLLIIHNQNSNGFAWNISGVLHNAASGTISSLTNDQVYMIQGIDDGSTAYWKIVSIQN